MPFVTHHAKESCGHVLAQDGEHWADYVNFDCPALAGSVAASSVLDVALRASAATSAAPAPSPSWASTAAVVNTPPAPALAPAPLLEPAAALLAPASARLEQLAHVLASSAPITAPLAPAPDPPESGTVRVLTAMLRGRAFALPADVTDCCSDGPSHASACVCTLTSTGPSARDSAALL